MTKCDLIIIGAGPGGYETAVKAAKEGLKTIIIEKDKIGGTCLNYGCIPTKCLCKTADTIREISEAEPLGLYDCTFKFNIEKAVERKNGVVKTLTDGVASLLHHPSITPVTGTAKFTDKHTVHVDDAKDRQGEPADTDYTADNVIIATGSVTKFLPIPGNHLKGVLTSTELLDLTSVPRRLCVIGGGVIGMEFASVFRTFGSEVTVLEFCKEILPNFDSDIAKRLKSSLKTQGINIINNAMVTAIAEKETDVYEVEYSLKGNHQTTEADILLMAVGRAANTASINLSDVGIESDKRGITVDKDFCTNVEGVFAIGDVNGQCQLAHAASFQGRHVINVITGKTDNIRFDIMPAAVFTHPEVSMVGVTGDYCKANNIEVKTQKAFFRANGKSLAMNETDGLVKILIDADNHIIGAHILGPHASDLIQEITALMNSHSDISALSNIIHAHPTLSEVVWAASE